MPVFHASQKHFTFLAKQEKKRPQAKPKDAYLRGTTSVYLSVAR